MTSRVREVTCKAILKAQYFSCCFFFLKFVLHVNTNASKALRRPAKIGFQHISLQFTTEVQVGGGSLQ